MTIDINGDVIESITIDGEFTEEVTVDGDVVFQRTSIPDSALSRWTFDTADISGGILSDSWASNDMTLNGITTGVSGANQTYTTNEAGSLDGTDDNGSIDEPFNASNAFSVAAWAFPTSGTAKGRVINARQTSQFVLDINSQNSGVWEVWTGGSWNENLASVDVSSWQHVCVTHDGSGGFAFFKNGSQAATFSSSVGSGSSGASTVGSNSDATGAFFTGDLDDIRTYDKELTGTEVSDLYNNGDIRG